MNIQDLANCTEISNAKGAQGVYAEVIIRRSGKTNYIQTRVNGKTVSVPTDAEGVIEFAGLVNRRLMAMTSVFKENV